MDKSDEEIVEQIKTYFLLKFGSMEEVWYAHRDIHEKRMNKADREMYRQYQIISRRKTWENPLRKTERYEP